MYYWEEKYENIWDYAPNPKRDKARRGRKEALKCVCKETSLAEHLDRFVDLFVAITPPGVADVLRTYFKDEICCCAKNYCKHEDPPLPEDELDDDLWELYTFFLNEFNTMDSPRLNGDDQSGSTSDLKGALLKASQPPEEGAAKTDPEGHPRTSKDEPRQAATAPEENADAALQEVADRWQRCAEDGDGRGLQLSPYFKLKVMEMVMDCMKQRDVHRYFLLQHIRLMLHYHRSLFSNADTDTVES